MGDKNNNSNGKKSEWRKKVKECFEKDMLLIWIVLSVACVVIVHFLFYIPAPFEWLRANWGAGEILTYISTVSLSLLAVWQNRRFKEENDKSQERLENLTSQANELSIINKIIEIENKRLNQVKEAMDDFTNACDAKLICNEYVKKSPIKLWGLTWRAEVENRMQQSLIKLVRILRIDQTLGGEEPIYQAVINHYSSTLAFVRELDKNGLNSDGISQEILDSIKKSGEKYMDTREAYLRSLELKLDQVIYGSLNLGEIRKLYHNK